MSEGGAFSRSRSLMMRDFLKKERRITILFHSFPHKEILHKLPIWLIATQRNPTPSMLLPALWSQKQAKQSHSSLQPLNKLGLSRGMGTKNLFVLSRSRESLPASHPHPPSLSLSFYRFKSVLVSIMMSCPNQFFFFFSKITRFKKHTQRSALNSEPLVLSIREISILDYFQTGPLWTRGAILYIPPPTFGMCIDMTQVRYSTNSQNPALN